MDSRTFSERELKFTLAKESHADALASAEKLGSDYVLQGDARVQHLDTYFDTDAYDLLRRGYSLRVRQVCDAESSQTLVTLKALWPGSGAFFERTEIEAPIDGGGAVNGKTPHIRAWPDALRSAVTELVAKPDALRPVAALRQERHKRLLSLNEKKKGKQTPSGGDRAGGDRSDPDPASPRPFAELSIDKVEVLRRVAPGVNGDAPMLARFDEVEIEQIAEAATDHLPAIGKLMARRRGFAPSPASKFARAFELVGNAMPEHETGAGAEITPETPMAEACRRIWRQQLTQLLLAEHGVRHQIDSEYVHTMRVAIRRARVAARLFGSYFRKRATAPHMRLLRKLGKRLGAVRDLDVALQGIARQDERFGKSTESAAVRSEWEARRDAAFSRLIAFLESGKYREFVVGFARFCGTNGAGVKKMYRDAKASEQHTVQSVMPQLLLKEFGRIRGYKSLVQSKKVSAQTLHDLRIDCKTMRYSLEFCEGLLGGDGAKVIRKLKDVQDALGAFNDAVVEQERLDKWLAKLGKREEKKAENHAGQADRKAVAARRKALAQTENKLRGEFPARFAKLVDADTRRALALAVANL